MRSELAAEAAPRAPFPLAAVGQEAPQAMARRMSTRAGMRSGEQLTSEDAFEATAGEKAEDAAEATPDEKAEDAEATADEKAEATVLLNIKPCVRRGEWARESEAGAARSVGVWGLPLCAAGEAELEHVGAVRVQSNTFVTG